MTRLSKGVLWTGVGVAILVAVIVPRMRVHTRHGEQGLRVLCSAISGRDSRAIKRYLDAGLPLNPVTGGKTTGHVECWTGGDYNLPCWESPLGDCAYGGRSAYAKLLIHRGADVNARCTDRITPLHYAARHSDLALLRVLLDHGAEVNARDVSGHVPLEVVHPYNVDGMILLFERGARYNLSSFRVRNEHAPETIPAPAMAGRQTTLNLMLVVASGHPHEESIRRLLRMGADPNYRDPVAGANALVWCAGGRRDPADVIGGSNPAAVARLLIERGADPNVRAHVRSSGRWAGRLPAVLLDVLDERPISGYTALELARYHKDSELEKLLLKHGAKGKLAKRVAR